MGGFFVLFRFLGDSVWVCPCALLFRYLLSDVGRVISPKPCYLWAAVGPALLVDELTHVPACCGLLGTCASSEMCSCICFCCRTSVLLVACNSAFPQRQIINKWLSESWFKSLPVSLPADSTTCPSAFFWSFLCPVCASARCSLRSGLELTSLFPVHNTVLPPSLSHGQFFVWMHTSLLLVWVPVW